MHEDPHTLRVDRGDIFWITPEGSAQAAPNLRHPYVVVQEDVFDHSRIATVVVCALSSNLQRAHEPGCLLLDDGEGGLPRQSVVVVSQIESVENASLGDRIRSLSAERVEQILSGLIFNADSG
jgi:mRNA interferase MazF